MDSRDDFALIFTTLFLVFKTKISFLVKFGFESLTAFRDDATATCLPGTVYGSSANSSCRAI